MSCDAEGGEEEEESSGEKEILHLARNCRKVQSQRVSRALQLLSPLISQGYFDSSERCSRNQKKGKEAKEG